MNKNNGILSDYGGYRPLNFQNKSKPKQQAWSPQILQKSNMYQRSMHKYQRQNLQSKNYLLKSRISQLNGSNVSQINEKQLFPQQLLFLLSNQKQNLEYFKEKINNQKLKATAIFEHLKNQLSLIVEDLKISIHTQLDKVYSNFIHSYANMKTQVTEFRKIRKQFFNNQYQSGAGQYFQAINKSVYTSNRNLLHQISRDAELFKNQKFYENLTQMQKQRINPIMKLAKKIIIIGDGEQTFYQQNEMTAFIDSLLTLVRRKIKEGFDELNTFVTTTDAIISQFEQQELENNAILNQLDSESIPSSQGRKSSKIPSHKNIDHQQSLQHNPYGINMLLPVTQRQNYQKKQQIKHSLMQKDIKRLKSNDLHRNYHINIESPKHKLQKSRKAHSQQAKQLGKKNDFWVSKDQQSIVTNWIEEISLRENRVIQCSHTDALLCTVFVSQGKNIATGSKDKCIHIYQIKSGKLIAKLIGHQASICCLANFQNFLASGGDNGCCSIIIWDSKTWTIRNKIKCHQAAVTCIIDVQDQCHMITAGYDKQIYILNYERGSILNNLQCKSSVAGLSLNADKSKLISSTLDGDLTVWKLFRKDGILENLKMERIIKSQSLICSLKAFAYHNDFFVCGNKDGKVKLINMNTGQIVKTLFVGSASVVELVTCERTNKPNNPIILSCLSKEKIIVYTKPDIGISDFINVNGKVNVQYGCGVGPKVVFNSKKQIAIVSQSPTFKEVVIYDLHYS